MPNPTRAQLALARNPLLDELRASSDYGARLAARAGAPTLFPVATCPSRPPAATRRASCFASRGRSATPLLVPTRPSTRG